MTPSVVNSQFSHPTAALSGHRGAVATFAVENSRLQFTACALLYRLCFRFPTRPPHKPQRDGWRMARRSRASEQQAPSLTPTHHTHRGSGWQHWP
eukprot:scaffold18784_cov112-Isochrysis_galbana.AAC.4